MLPRLVLKTRLGEHAFTFGGEPRPGLPQVIGALEPRLAVRWGQTEMTPRDLVALAVGIMLLVRGVTR